MTRFKKSLNIAQVKILRTCVMPVVRKSKCHQYTATELDPAKISDIALAVLGKKPFDWQLEACIGVLTGNDVILDVGTGCGKSLCFQLPLLMSKTDIALTISPLTALMIDQASHCKVGKGLNNSSDILNGQYQQVLISPEIVVSAGFHRAVTMKKEFSDHLRVVIIDEAHCVTIWGGSFRPEYASLGEIRGRLPKNVPILIASATLPDHVLADVRTKLQLSSCAKVISVTNARPNIALSVRIMKKAEATMSDLRFLIPPDAKESGDIKI
ncbi:hypothetical protein CVT24_003287, partial [Panaeolus cyanescens]